MGIYHVVWPKAREGSGADEAGVEGTGQGDVGGSLNDGAAIAEEGEGVGRALKAEEKIIEADLPMGCEAVAHGGEVDGTVVLVNLDGVSSAEGDVGTAFAGEMSELPLAADGAVRTGPVGGDLGAFARPQIKGE